MMRSTLADYAYFIVACLTNDNEYVRGIIKGDDNEGYVIEGSGRKVTLPRGASDAAIAPRHFERSNRSPDAREDASQNRVGSN